MNKSLDYIFPTPPADLDPSQLDAAAVPQHVAVIMDGNGRWAKERGKNRLFGHKAGIEAVRETIRCASDVGVRYLTIYSFSSENWKRPQDEVIGLMNLFATTTKDNDGMTLVVAVNYGGRVELLDAMRSYMDGAHAALREGREPEPLSEATLSRHLYTADIPDPDLLIRTSGEMRVSNFLLWQIAYSEFVCTETLWPDFDRYEFLRALLEFQSRDRRFGAVK